MVSSLKLGCVPIDMIVLSMVQPSGQWFCVKTQKEGWRITTAARYKVIQVNYTRHLQSPNSN